jgi:hypothetical protein
VQSHQIVLFSHSEPLLRCPCGGAAAAKKNPRHVHDDDDDVAADDDDGRRGMMTMTAVKNETVAVVGRCSAATGDDPISR